MTTNNSNETTQDRTRQNKTKQNNEFKMFIFKREFLKISVDLQTAFSVGTHLVHGGATEHGKRISQSI
jgi:hypothetical protein